MNPESLERLEGKIGEGPFFEVRSDRITVCTRLFWSARLLGSSEYVTRYVMKWSMYVPLFFRQESVL